MAKSIVISQLIVGLLLVSFSFAQAVNQINVKEYGAKGDGKTNDTKAIKEAFAKIYKSGGTVYFPSGNYLTNIIDIRPSEGTIIEVKGDKGNTLIIKNPEDKSAVALFFCEIPKVTLVFNSLSLEGSSSARIRPWKQFKNSGTYDLDNAVHAIFVYNLRKITVSGCTIQNFHGDGISTYSTTEFIAHNNTIKNVNGTSIKGHRVVNMDIFENRIENTGFFSQQFTVSGQQKKRAVFFPKTRFGDGIEADCDVLTAKNNTIINPGRCGIVHDLAIDLGYKNSSATVENNTITVNSSNINNGNPPAGMWFEQSASVKVIRNKIEIIKSTSKLVTGIRFYGITDSIVCENNTISASQYNLTLDNGIGVFEPEASSIQVTNNIISGKFESGLAISYDSKKAHINHLLVEGNKINGQGKLMKHAVQVYTGGESTRPKNQVIKNNTFSNIASDHIYTNPK